MQTYLRLNFMESIENFYYYFLERRVRYSELLFEKMTEYTDNLPRETIASFVIQLDDKLNKYERYYSNILNIFGNIGGLLKIIMTIASLIIRPFSQILV